MKRILYIIGSFFCILGVLTMVLLASSLFNETIKEGLFEIGGEALGVMKEFSKKAEINLFKEP